MNDAAAVNATRWALVEALCATGRPVESASGGRTKCNRSRLGIPKTHALDAVCVGEVAAVTGWQRPTLTIKAAGRGSYKRTRLDSFGFPRMLMNDNQKTEIHGVATLSQAAQDVLMERQRQVSAEGWTPEHDDAHDSHEMAHAAACYAYPELTALIGVKTWPWALEWLKVRDHRRNYVRAAALLLAEIERLDRKTFHTGDIQSRNADSTR